MEMIRLLFLCVIALCSAVEDTFERDPVVKDPADFSEDLQDFIQRLTQHQRQTTQNLQSALLPQLNIPRMRTRVEGEPERVDSPMPFLNFPFHSNSGKEAFAHSYASSSASIKRPHSGGTNMEAQASAVASVKDVNDEENLGEVFDADINSLSDKISSPSEFQKDTTKMVEAGGTTKGDSNKEEPYFLHHQQIETVVKAEDSFSDVYFVAIVAGCCAVGIFGVISAGICFYKLQKSRKAAADVDYPAYGVTGPNKDVSSPNGDRKLAQSAQMYHYQHQKQQMIAVEKAGATKNTSASDVDSEEENTEGDYTVYECPGLAPTDEMEVKNPLFHDDSTPVSPPVLPSNSDSNQNN